jgi:hypothetical protein
MNTAPEQNTMWREVVHKVWYQVGSVVKVKVYGELLHRFSHMFDDQASEIRNVIRNNLDDKKLL